MKAAKTNLVSIEYTATKTFNADNNRNYLFITFTAGTGTVEFGGKGGKVPIEAGGHIEPYVVHTGAFTVETVGGTYVVVSDKQA